MTTARIHDAVRNLKERLARQQSSSVTDATLLDGFLKHRDEDAFAELVRRHATLVYGVCRRLLRNSHDAEDAFQATFLVLIRKGSAARQVRSLGCWLYGVARRTALEARRAAARRRLKEAGAMAGPATDAPESCDWRELLDAEIDRLPEKVRAPLVLCDLEGKTRKEAARLLGWPEGTVASRLANARSILAKRLKRQGVGLSGAVPALPLTGDEAIAVPPGLANSTIEVAAGRALVSSGVATLVKGALMSMLLKKLKATAILVTTATVLCLGGTTFRALGGAEARAADGKASTSELDALRHEIELLKVNLHVLLEKVHAQESELASFKDLNPGKQLQIQTHFLGGAPAVDSKKPGTSSIGFHADPKITVDPVVTIRSDLKIPTVKTTIRTDLIDISAAPTATIRTDAKPTGIVKPAVTGELYIEDDDPIRRAEAALQKLQAARDGHSRQEAASELAAILKQLKPTKPVITEDGR